MYFWLSEIEILIYTVITVNKNNPPKLENQLIDITTANCAAELNAHAPHSFCNLTQHKTKFIPRQLL